MKLGTFFSNIMFIVLMFFGTAADADTERDKAIADFVLNFIKFTVWPDLPAGASINLCAAASPNMLSILSGFAGKTVVGHPLQVIDLSTPSRQRCQTLYIEQGSASWCDCRCLEATRQMLTISDKPDFIGRCGIIGLYEENGQLRFEVNLNNAERSGIRLSSQLLRLNRFKREKPP